MLRAVPELRSTAAATRTLALGLELAREREQVRKLARREALIIAALSDQLACHATTFRASESGHVASSFYCTAFCHVSRLLSTTLLRIRLLRLLS